MRVLSLHLENFRNYIALDLEFGSRVNVLYGYNAQGKTNVIEALYLSASVRSHRTSKDKELISHGKDYYKVCIDIQSDRHNSRSESLALAFYDAEKSISNISKKRRQAFHNSIELDKISRYFGLFNAVIFAPEDLLLIKEGPSVRRRFMDILISQIRPSYFYDIQQYSRFLNQRNRVLKQLRAATGKIFNHQSIPELDAWDSCMAPYAARIIIQRKHFSRRIAECAARFHDNISDQKETLELRYHTVTGVNELGDDFKTLLMPNADPNPEVLYEIESFLLSKWKQTQSDDIDKGVTGIGPHRDDLEISLNNLNIRLYASQGQQRSAALALKLSELSILQEETDEMPVLLLDDVFSELDAYRRMALLKSLGESQVFITCTDRDFVSKELRPLCPSMFSDTDSIRYFHVREGRIEVTD
ncbi:MAG: DNA replication/repair protein RecF [Clostridiaceae bacterium]|nr:DNA replication/repair protein RecF [Clostridiaceae bacterium]